MGHVLETLGLVDRVLTTAGALAVVVVLVFVRRSRSRPDAVWQMSRASEMATLGFVLAVALVIRLSGLSTGIPAYWDAVVNTDMVDEMLKGSGILSTLRSLVSTFQGGSYFTNLPLLLPFATAIQMALGPSLEQQAYAGAFFGIVGIGFAWLFGRLHRDALFGLLFAGLLAVSLIQLLWSRVGGPYLAGGAHVLAVVVLGFQAGRRRSILAALAGGVLAALCLYDHYQARLSLPLVYVGLVAGAARGERPLRTIVLLGLVVSAALVSTLEYLGATSLRLAIWPDTGGDVGNQGETSLAELVQKNFDACLARLRDCLAILFVDRRGSWGFGWGLEKGGMLVGVAIGLGTIGLVASLLHPIRELVPLAIVGLGLAVAVLSEAQTRKLVMFDVGWQLLAATGLYEVLRLPALAARGRRTLAVAGAVGLVLTAVWSFAALAVTTRRAGTFDLPYRQFSHSIFGDGYDSPRTYPVARMWQAWMREGYVVVFVNTDNLATNLATYGRVAALAAGRPGYFQSFYRLDNPERAHLLHLVGGPTPLPDALLELVRRTRARGMVWWFERPTRWEAWLAGELGRRGAIVETWPPDATAAYGPPTRFAVIEGIDLEQVLRGLAPIDVPHEGHRDVCLELSHLERRTMPTPFASAVARVRPHDPTAEWIVAAGDGLFVGDRLVQVPGRIAGLWHDGAEIALVTTGGDEIRLRADAPGEGAPSSVVTLEPEQTIGANCAARVGDGWWLVDPVHGTVSSNQPTDWIPSGAWVGVTAGAGGRLILASADQRIAILRPATREVERVFPAHVWESLKLFDFGSCAVVRTLAGYVASFETSELLLALYTADGRERATLRLTTAMPDLVDAGVTAIDTDGSWLVLTQAQPPAAHVLSVAVLPADETCAGNVRLVGSP